MRHSRKIRTKELIDRPRLEIAKDTLAFAWKTSLAPCVILCGLVLVVFYSIVHFGFINWDDDKNFIDNPWVKGFLHPRYWIWAWSTRLMDVYQPISWIFLINILSPVSCII